MREGGLEAPTRHVIPWQDRDFVDRAKTEAEMLRVFDICQSCRRCFNLCDSFPRLFDLIDESPTGEVDGVATADYHKVAFSYAEVAIQYLNVRAASINVDDLEEFVPVHTCVTAARYPDKTHVERE